MPFFSQLFLVFVLVPLSDLVILIMLLRVHWALTLLWILVSATAGAWFVRRQGLAVVNRLREALGRNEMPTDVLADGLLLLFAGALLITPGLLTDLFGFSILVPLCRKLYRRWLMAWLKRHITIRTFVPEDRRRSDVVDGEVVEGDIVDGDVWGRGESERDRSDPPKLES